MKSAMYSGTVFHKRFSPKIHAFRYRVFMILLDLDELNQVLNQSMLCSKRWWAVLRFKREDFHGNPEHSIKASVYKTVQSQLGLELNGPVRVLSQWRYLGFNFNPMVTYYCFDASGDNLVAVVAEVTNTPWLERHAYAMRATSQGVDSELDKAFTVSPFNPINMRYAWKSSAPSHNLKVQIDTYQQTDRTFHASMVLDRQEITSKSILMSLLRFPFSTLGVVCAIYWQALRLFLKGVPFLGKDKVLDHSK